MVSSPPSSPSPADPCIDGDATIDATVQADDDEVTQPPERDGDVGLPRGTEIGRYLILGEIGRGATARVYSAYDGDLDRRLALKLVTSRVGDDERRRVLLREAQSMAKIRHPNVVVVHDVGTYQQQMYVAMEFVDGVTLSRWCNAPGRRRDEILDAFVQAGLGLAAAHAVGVVHRDFKPDNVLVDAAGTVHVVDFGLALHATTAGPDAAPRAVGTPAYMSPEHYAGTGIDARSDQFSYCVALFEALAGTRPFRGVTLAELATHTLEQRVEPDVAAAIPRRLREVVLRGLGKAPEERHASMDALLLALRRARRARWPRWLALAAGMTAVGGLALYERASPNEGCPSGSDRIAPIWGDATAASLRLADAELAPEFVRSSEAELRGALDDYAERWARLHDEVCPEIASATAHDELARAREACVDDRLASFAGLVAFFAEHTVSPTRLRSLLATLPDLRDCGADRVTRAAPVPSDPVVAEEARELWIRSQQVERLVRWEEAVGAVPDLESIIARARELDQPHLVTRVLLVQAEKRFVAGDVDGSQEAIDDALFTALSAGSDGQAVEAISRMIWQTPRSPRREPHLRRWFGVGMALVERLGGDTTLRGELRGAWAGRLAKSGDHLEALAMFELAAQDFDEALGPGGSRAAEQLFQQGVALASLRRYDEARERISRAIEGFESFEGRERRALIAALQALAFLEEELGDHRTAVVLIERSADLTASIYGSHGRVISDVAYNLAMFEALGGDARRADEALAHSRRAWPVVGDVVAEAEFAYADAMLAELRGDPVGALVHSDRALRLYMSVGSVDPRALVTSRELRVTALTLLGAHRRALEEAEATFHSADPLTLDPEAMRTIAVHSMLAALALGDRDLARLWLARSEIRPPDTPRARTVQRLAQALLDETPSPSRIAETAAARDQLVSMTFETHPLVRVYDAWLGAHAGPPP